MAPSEKLTLENAPAALEVLDAEMPLGPEHATQRVLWVLRLLLKTSRRSRAPCALDDPDTRDELGLVYEGLDDLSPTLLHRWLEHRLQQLEGRPLVLDSIGQNTRWLAERLGLSQAERKVLAFAATAEASRSLENCLTPFRRHSSGQVIQLLAELLEEPADTLRATVSPRSLLMRSGVLRFPSIPSCRRPMSNQTICSRLFARRHPLQSSR